jgi:lysophospholipase L1-like esterase
LSFLNIIQNLSKGTGTTGGGTPPVDPISPADVAAVINWYDVTDNAAIVTSSGRLTQLTDKKSSRNVTESITLYPAYSATGGSNNKAYITINENQYIRDGAGSWTGTGGAITFAVIRLSDLTPYLNGASDYKNAIIGYQGRNRGLVMNNLTGGYIPTLYDYTGNVHFDILNYGANTDWQVISFRMYSSLTEFIINNQPAGITCRTQLAADAASEINIGYIGLGARFQLSELVIADSTISSDDEKGIITYLLNKYQITPKQFLHTYGDSLTAGSCDPANNWPFIVAADNGWQLANFGVGGTIVQPNAGSTGVSGKNFIDVLPTALKWPYQGQWTVVGFGVNDTNQGGINSTWKTLYKARLQEMLTWGFNPNKFILTIPPSTSIRQSLMAQTNTYISEIASELGLILFDANALFLANGGDSLFADTLHPNGAGNVLTANAITDIINS